MTVSDVDEPETAYPIGADGLANVAKLIETVVVSEAAR